ncbi:hypothetical protein PSEUDO8AS_10435 [Pseudomonas sp. 8AS]|nr:hypothetical protein PSEUDO8AS_10435 [Pseudomonas sp. 8AS]
MLNIMDGRQSPQTQVCIWGLPETLLMQGFFMFDWPPGKEKRTGCLGAHPVKCEGGETSGW